MPKISLSNHSSRIRLLLKFPQRTAMVEAVSMTKFETRLVDITDHMNDHDYSGERYRSVPWPSWHELIPEHYGLDKQGYVHRWEESCTTEEMKAILLNNVPEGSLPPDFQGYFTMDHGRFAMTDGFRICILHGLPSEKRVSVQLLPGPVMRADKLFHPDGKPFIKNTVLALPYVPTHCWVTLDGRSVFDLDTYLSFVDKHMDQVADPFGWTVRKKMISQGMNLNIGIGGLGNIAPEFEEREELVLQEDEIPWPKF